MLTVTLEMRPYSTLAEGSRFRLTPDGHRVFNKIDDSLFECDGCIYSRPDPELHPNFLVVPV